MLLTGALLSVVGLGGFDLLVRTTIQQDVGLSAHGSFSCAKASVGCVRALRDSLGFREFVREQRSRLLHLRSAWRGKGKRV